MDKDRCEFYPVRDDDPVCGAGSDITGGAPCTKEYGRTCRWAVEERTVHVTPTGRRVKDKPPIQRLPSKFTGHMGE